MKKLIKFVVVFILFIIIILLFINKKENYSKEYELDDSTIVEEYNKDTSYYTFKVTYEKQEYDFVYEHKYTRSRKLVKEVNVSNVNDDICLNIKVFGEVLDNVCYKDKEYSLLNVASNEDILVNDLYKKENNISIYNKNYDYYIWNGYGITNVLKKKDYNFLSKETYDNDLYYEYDKYILFADYDQKRTFNKFYVFDLEKKKVSEFTFDYDISFDSYFMGDYDGYIYLMDKKNVVQYKINVNKKNIEVSSNEDAGFYYNKSEDTLVLKKLKYNNYNFIYNNKYNYMVNDNTLYLYYYNSDLKYKVSNLDVVSIVKVEDDVVYYLSGDSLYRFSLKDGEEKLMTYFEWNFTTEGKVFIYN